MSAVKEGILVDPRVVLAVVIAVGLVAGFVALVVRQKRRLREAYQGFATARGLAFQPGSFPCAHGEVGGRRVFVGNEMGRKVNDVVQFVIRISLRGPVPRVFIAMGRALLTGPGKVSTGDASFDKKVRVDGEEPEAIQRYLTPERREAILRLCATGGWVVGEQAAILKGAAEVCWAKTGMTPDAAWLEARFSELERFAPALDA